MIFNRPKFITFEGCEGSGKSTQSKKLYEYLLSKRIKAIYTREIGGTVEAEKIRRVLLYSELLPLSELMLVNAARYEHVNKLIIPAMLTGAWVICDRFIDSTACYQATDNIDAGDIYALHKQLIKPDKELSEKIIAGNIELPFSDRGFMPDITFFLNVPPGTGLQRARDRGDVNKYEDKPDGFHDEIYRRFCDIAEKNPERVRKIECTDLDSAEISKVIIKHLFPRG